MKIEYSEQELLRGLEIVATRDRKTGNFSFSAKWHSWTDFLWFFVEGRYCALAESAFGNRWIYILYYPVMYPERSGLFFYLLPAGLAIEGARMLRRAWFSPLWWLRRKGFVDLAEGSRPALFWPVHIRTSGYGQKNSLERS